MPYSWTVEQRDANGVSVIHMDLVTAKTRAKQFEFGSMASLVTGSKGWIWVSRQGIRTEPASLAEDRHRGEREARHPLGRPQAELPRRHPEEGAADLADHRGRARGNDVPAIRHRDAAAAQAALGSEGRTIHRRRAGQPPALTRNSSALELHDMRISVFALTTAAAVILTTAGPDERATAAQTPTPAAQPQARRRRARRRSHAGGAKSRPRNARKSRSPCPRRRLPRRESPGNSSSSIGRGFTTASHTAATARFLTPISRCS